MSTQDSNTAHNYYDVNQSAQAAANFGGSLFNLPPAYSLGVNIDVYRNIEQGYVNKNQNQNSSN